MRSRTIFLATPQARNIAHALIDAAPDSFVCKVAEATRTDRQNRKLWPMIKDVREQVPGMDAFSPNDTKMRFMNALGVEMRFLPELEGAGMFPVGMRSSVLTKSQFAGLIDMIYEFGGRNGVRWSERSDA